MNDTHQRVLDTRAEFETILQLRALDWSEEERFEARKLLDRIRPATYRHDPNTPVDFSVFALAAQAIAVDRQHTCTAVLVEWIRTTSEHLCALLEGRRVL